MENRNEPIAGQTMAAKIAERIRDDIIRRSIPPGSRITVKEIADRYGVSSKPVREAFNMLGGEQLLRLNPYRGATVMAVTSDLMTQLNDVQSALESLLVELCLQKGYSKDLLEQMEAVNRQIADTGSGERERRFALNTEFHTLEYSPCKNHMAFNLFQRTVNQLHTIRRYYPAEAESVKKTVQEHQQILQCLRSRDVVSAIAITKLHSKLHIPEEESYPN